MLDGPASPLPEACLPKRLGDPLGFDRRLASEQGPEEFDRPGHERPRREAAPIAAKSFVGPDDEQRMQVLLRFVPLRPAAVDGGPGQRADLNRNDLQGIAPRPVEMPDA